MTTAIHHGDPGSFKSFGTIMRVVIPALYGEHENYEEGRTVVTNIRGLTSIAKIEEAMGKKVGINAELINVHSDSNQGYALMARFFHWAPKGALIVIDESQRVYSKRRDRNLQKYDLIVKDDYDNELTDTDALQKQFPYWDGDYDRPINVENAFDQHRHYNWDIYLLTPNISKLHPEVREVAEIGYRHRCRGSLLPWWKNHWKEFPHDAEASGKQVSHYEGSPKKYKADQRIFPCYKSTKTGKAKSSTETRYIYRDPKLVLAFGFIAIVVTGFFYQAAAFYNEKQAVMASNKTADPAAENAAQTAQADTAESGAVSGNADPQFAALEARFNELSAKPVEQNNTQPEPQAPRRQAFSVDTPLYLTEQADVRLSALLTTASGKLFYRLTSYDDNGNLMDEFTQTDLQELGYEAMKIGSGLQIRKGEESFMVRRWVIGRSASREDNAAMQGGSAGGA